MSIYRWRLIRRRGKSIIENQITGRSIENQRKGRLKHEIYTETSVGNLVNGL